MRTVRGWFLRRVRRFFLPPHWRSQPTRGRIFGFLLSILGCFRGIVAGGTGEIEVGCISFKSWAICEASGPEGSGVGAARVARLPGPT